MARPSAEQRKEMIIEAVLALFREKGMAASSTRDIAERTGLARSHVYHYFKDWKELCLCAVKSAAILLWPGPSCDASQTETSPPPCRRLVTPTA